MRNHRDSELKYLSIVLDKDYFQLSLGFFCETWLSELNKSFLIELSNGTVILS